jgi:hypothetical protein
MCPRSGGSGGGGGGGSGGDGCVCVCGIKISIFMCTLTATNFASRIICLACNVATSLTNFCILESFAFCFQGFLAHEKPHSS